LKGEAGVCLDGGPERKLKKIEGAALEKFLTLETRGQHSGGPER